MRKHYDLLAIGGGSGGLSAAERAAMHGKKAAVVEMSKMGGTCVNVGCVPKKVMWNGASIAHALRDAKGYGFDVMVNNFDWAHLVKGREDYIQGINDWYGSYLDDSKIDWLKGQARFIDANTLQVAGEQYTADHIVISPGGVAMIPDIPGAEHGITSDGFFALTEQPKRVAVVGAGYIAVELAGLLKALGSDVDLLLRRQHFLASFDAIRSLLDTVTVIGATIVTHGFQPVLFGSGDSLMDLAAGIRTRADEANGPDQGAWLLDYDLLGAGGQGVFDREGSILPDTSTVSDDAMEGELVLLFDWALESDELSSGWAEAAGDACV